MYCEADPLDFDAEKEGIYAYLTEEEVILSKKKIVEGRFECPNELQQELLAQTILKNMEEILISLESNSLIGVPVYTYVTGVRIFLNQLVTPKEVNDYLEFQPWRTEINIDTEHFYPYVEVKCQLKNKLYCVVDQDTDKALFRIYQEYIAQEKKREHEK